MAANNVCNESGGIASKVTNIDGNPLRGILKKSVTQGSNSKMAGVDSKKGEGSYAQTLKLKNGGDSSKVEMGRKQLDGKEDMEEVEVENDTMEVADFIVEGKTSKSEGASTPDIKKETDLNPFDLVLRSKEAEIVKRFKEASLDEELFLKQKSKVEWLVAGDNNTRFFHNSLKSRTHRSRIDIIMDGGGTIHEADNVQKAFVNHYENFLGCEGEISLEPTPDLFLSRLDENVANKMALSQKEKQRYRGNLFAYLNMREAWLIDELEM
ncbi:hypothetical protein QVD17_07170 [Tagetes erecta]|uniref:RNA-directed DNA polymerase, eukaryota, reverse transcriptase zinc-binding domain protein n=1 Tax=Tagetes erecta TaxID=13708 RepID=A0AAD8LKW4_TARER|nr:hypothetical protein QVD17_07170 [Tagetes erecta]